MKSKNRQIQRKHFQNTRRQKFLNFFCLAPTSAASLNLAHLLVSPQKFLGFITAYHMCIYIYIYIYIYIIYKYIPYIKLILSVVPCHTRKKSNQWILIHNIMNFGSNWFQITHFAKRAFYRLCRKVLNRSLEQILRNSIKFKSVQANKHIQTNP